MKLTPREKPIPNFFASFLSRFILSFILCGFQWGCLQSQTDGIGITTVGESFSGEESGLVEFGVDGQLDGSEIAEQRSVSGVQLNVLKYEGDWEFKKLNSFVTGTALSQASGSKMIFTSEFVRFNILFQAPHTYQNPGKVKFSLDGKTLETVDLLNYRPVEGSIVPYVVSTANGHLKHVVVMELLSGSVAISGFQASFLASPTLK